MYLPNLDDNQKREEVADTEEPLTAPPLWGVSFAMEGAFFSQSEIAI